MSMTATEDRSFEPPANRRPRTTPVVVHDPASEQTHGAGDPGQDPVDAIVKRMKHLLDNSGDYTVGRLTVLRDGVDALMREHNAEQKRILDDVERYAHVCKRTIAAEGLMSQSLATLKQEVGEVVKPTVSALRRS